MYTEIALSEFSIRARLKLGDLAEQITLKLQRGVNADSLMEDSKELRVFLNSVNSDYKKWNDKDIYKRLEHYADRFDLVDKPKYTNDWLDKFKAPSRITKVAANVIEVPAKSTGYMYADNGRLVLKTDRKYTLNDLPNA